MIPANNHPEIDRLIHLKKHLGGMTMSKLISIYMLPSSDISEGCPVISFSSVFCDIFFCPAVQPLSSSTAVSRSGNTLRYMVYPSFLRR